MKNVEKKELQEILVNRIMLIEQQKEKGLNGFPLEEKDIIDFYNRFLETVSNYESYWGRINRIILGDYLDRDNNLLIKIKEMFEMDFPLLILNFEDIKYIREPGYKTVDYKLELRK